MEAMRDKWSDERMDDLNHRVSDGFNRVDANLRALRGETNTGLSELRGDMNARFEQINARFDSMQRLMAQAAVAMSAAFLAGFAAVVGLVATQL
jgi:hypothetical protein